MVKACIFDMDGTTVNTINSIAHFANKALNKYGLPSIETERYKLLVGNGAVTLVKRMIAETGGSAEQFEKVLNEYNTTYDNDFMYLTKPYEGITGLLESLKKSGIKTAIVSNKPDSTAKKVSDKLFGEKLIDVCFGAREGVPLKPDPAAVFEVMEILGVAPQECLYIGDTAVDMTTGKNAGIFTIGVLWGFRDRKEIESAGADMVTDNVNDILKTAIEK
ncbi:MAG: HAD family hydrolase [Ruminococcaceae bacterium]|nr:HAD family hydrolase [Oscillospiraceae bacterium]